MVCYGKRRTATALVRLSQHAFVATGPEHMRTHVAGLEALLDNTVSCNRHTPVAISQGRGSTDEETGNSLQTAAKTAPAEVSRFSSSRPQHVYSLMCQLASHAWASSACTVSSVHSMPQYMLLLQVSCSKRVNVPAPTKATIDIDARCGFDDGNKTSRYTSMTSYDTLTSTRAILRDVWLTALHLLVCQGAASPAVEFHTGFVLR